MKKFIAQILLLLCLFQSCAIYRPTPVSLEEAAISGKVKVQLNNGHFIVTNVAIKDGVPVQVVRYNNIDGVQVPEYTPLPSNVESYFVQNRPATAILNTLGITIITLGTLVGLAVYAYNSNL